MKKSRKNLIFVCPTLSTFIAEDIKIFQSEYNVSVNQYDWNKKWLTPFFMIKQAVYILGNFNNIDNIIVSFGGYWSLVPSALGKLLNKPVFIILHGTDCASIPSINYGSLRSKIRRNVLRFSYYFAKKLLPVSASLVNTDNMFYVGEKENLQGIKTFFPRLKTNISVIHNGLDDSFWKINFETSRNSKSFISSFSEKQFYLKGGDLILEVAKEFPDHTFNFVGLDKPSYANVQSDNVFFLGRKSQDELLRLFNENSYYLQLSIFEGFGMSLCEAMLCGCIPIGSDVNMIPEIIGDSGFIVKERSTDALLKVLSNCIQSRNKSELRLKARERIVNNYSINLRSKLLLEQISD